MEEFIILANKTLSGREENLYTNASGAVIKTILLHNSTGIKTEATLKLDSVAFKFALEAEETKVLSSPILTKAIKGTGDGVNIHITGLQL